jgi:hypothetical protein
MLSFAKIVQGRDSSVRVTDDGLMDVVDTIMAVTGKDCNHSNHCFRELKPSLFDNQKVVMRNQRRYVTLKDAITLIMVLPGKIAKEIRSQFADIIEDYIKTNTTPVFDDSGLLGFKHRREELELVKLEQDIQDKRIKNMENSLGLLTRIRPDWQQADVRFRLQTEDMIKNIITVPLGSKHLLTKDGEPARATPASLSISQLVQEMKIRALKHGDSCRVGALAAKRYREAHDEDPPKHPQWVDGVERKVNSYTEADRGMLVGVLHELGLAPGSSSASSVASDDCY